MILLNGTEVIIKPYSEKDTEEIVRLIHRNFIEVNMKDYGEKAMAVLSATYDTQSGIGGIEKNVSGNVFWEKVGFTVRDELVYRNKNIHQLKRIDLI